MSETFAYRAIEHLKSGLSISSHSGCSLNCAYCLLHAGTDGASNIITVASPNELVDQLLQTDTLFFNGMTPLFINNRTDPFLPKVCEHTLQILDLLVENAIRSPVVLVSKLSAPAELKRYCEALPLMVIFSYSALEEDFNFNAIRSIDQFAQNIPARHLFHYMRPIIPGKNDTVKTLRNTLQKFAEAGFAGSIISGIRLTQGNLQYLGAQPEMINAHKLLSPSVYHQLLSDPVLAGIEYPLFRHTSCAIDYFMKRANRLGYYLRSDHCNPMCANRHNCEMPAPAVSKVYEKITARFPEMVIDCDRKGVVIHTPVSQELTAFIRNAYGVQVKAEKIILSPSEEVLANVQ